MNELYNDDNLNEPETEDSQNANSTFLSNGFLSVDFEKLINGLVFQLKNKKQTLCSISNGEYEINLIDILRFNDADACQLLIECVKSRFVRVPKVSILDIYEYLDQTHFLSFVLARYGFTTWIYEKINKQVHITNSSKIVILVETSRIDLNILEEMHLANSQESITMIDSSIPNTPIIVNKFRAKSYYNPILRYDLSFGINSQDIDFNNMNMVKFYDTIFHKYIEEAIETFYPGYENSNGYAINGEKLIRVQFNFDCSDKTAKNDNDMLSGICF